MFKNPKYSFQYFSSVEAGLSDHHHLIFSIMKTKLDLEEPKRLVYRNFRNFNNDYFEKELSSKLDLRNKGYTTFEDNFVNPFNKYVLKILLRVIINHIYPRI